MIERIRREQREKDLAEMAALQKQHNKDLAEMVALQRQHRKTLIQKLLRLMDTESEIDFIKEEIPRLIEQEIIEIQFSLDQED